MDTAKLSEDMARCARQFFESGETSAKLRKRADEQDAAGFGVSASYTRMLASYVEAIEQKGGAE